MKYTENCAKTSYFKCTATSTSHNIAMEQQAIYNCYWYNIKAALGARFKFK